MAYFRVDGGVPPKCAGLRQAERALQRLLTRCGSLAANGSSGQGLDMEARYMMAVAMVHWPPDSADEAQLQDALARFGNLADQQPIRECYVSLRAGDISAPNAGRLALLGTAWQQLNLAGELELPEMPLKIQKALTEAFEQAHS